MSIDLNYALYGMDVTLGFKSWSILKTSANQTNTFKCGWHIVFLMNKSYVIEGLLEMFKIC
jgi:hypothetical protein